MATVGGEPFPPGKLSELSRELLNQRMQTRQTQPWTQELRHDIESRAGVPLGVVIADLTAVSKALLIVDTPRGKYLQALLAALRQVLP